MNASRTTNKVGRPRRYELESRLRGVEKKKMKNHDGRGERDSAARRTKEERVDWRRGRARYCRLIRQLRSIGWQGGRPDTIPEPA